jgi:hypothetical protein
MIALALWLCVVAWVGAMIASKPTAHRGYAEDEDSAAMAQLQQGLRHNQDMKSAVAALSRQRGSLVAAPVVAPSPAPMVGNDGMTPLDGGAVAGRALSLIISTEGSRRAVIDGQLVRAGSRLDDGSTVRGISASTVRIEDLAGQMQTLVLPSPYQDKATTELRR